MPPTIEQVQQIIEKYRTIWNADSEHTPLWVVGASPGDSIQIPDITFGDAAKPQAGMSIPIRGELIVLNPTMVPSSILSTFLHEYGHTLYRDNHGSKLDEVASEAEAIRFSLEILVAEGFEDLAFIEAHAITRMAVEEPYKSAVAMLVLNPLWRKYAPRT